MEGSIKELVSHRISRAEDDLATSKLLLDDGSYMISLNRSYYAIFHAIVLLILSMDLTALSTAAL